MFKRKKKDKDKKDDKSLSLCLMCSFAVKGGHGEDYYCAAKKEKVSWNSIDKGEITDCLKYEDIESSHHLRRGRFVLWNVMCPVCGSRNILRAGYGSRFICDICGKVFR